MRECECGCGAEGSSDGAVCEIAFSGQEREGRVAILVELPPRLFVLCILGFWLRDYLRRGGFGGWVLGRGEGKEGFQLLDESGVAGGFGLQEAVQAQGFLVFAALEGDGFEGGGVRG